MTPPDEPEVKEAESEELPYPKPGYAWFVVGILMVFYTFSFIDRTILNLMVEPIKRDMKISDTQMSLLMGFSFAILYALLGVPFGRLADRTSRKWIMGGGLFFWSIMTAGSGIARTYAQLLLFRVGVGVGEATLSPSAYSTIADYFPPSKHGRAFSVYAMGITIGAGLALGVGGFVVGWTERQGAVEIPIFGQIYSWQVAFLVVGFAGLVPLLLLFAYKEPLRRGVRMITDASGKKRIPRMPWGEFVSFQKLNLKAIVCHHTGAAILSFSGYGVGYWAPAFMIRRHGWTYEQIGIFFMMHVIVAGCAGLFFGGWLCDRLYKKGYVDAPLRVGLIASILWIPTGLLYPLVPNGWMAWGLMIPTYFIGNFPTGILAAAVMNMNPNTMRGTAAAIFLLVVNLVGQAFGPTSVALITDYVFDDPNKLHYSMVIVGAVCHAIAIPAFYFGMKPYAQSVKRAEVYRAA